MQKTKGVGRGLLPVLVIIVKDQQVKVGVEVLPLPVMLAVGMTVLQRYSKNWEPLIKNADYKVDRGAVQMKVVLVYHKSLQQKYLLIYETICNLVNQHRLRYRFK